MPVGSLGVGEVGYVVTGLKDPSLVKVGDTITLKSRPASDPLPGYRDVKPMVFTGLYPIEGDQYEPLKEALEKLALNDPALVVLDEPTSGLDPIGRREVKDLILDLGRMGKTVLLSSHLLAEVSDVCTRVAILAGGRVRAEGRLADLLEERDRIRFTAAGLPDAAVPRVKESIAAAGAASVSVDHPAATLEDYFLDVVGGAAK